MKKALILFGVFVLVLMGCEDDVSDFLGVGEGATGVGGSTSRFVIKGDYLYIATETELKVLQLGTDVTNVVESLPTLGDLETIFSLGDYLFIGAASGVYLYDIQEPTSPQYITRYVHQTACDPVIASGNFAYVTLREGNACGSSSDNQLITLDISDIDNPVAVDVVSMRSPRGLALYQGNLYVGEGIYGLKKFDLSDPSKPKLDTFYINIQCNDLIPLDSHLIITENNGVHQYLVNADSINLLSTIE